MKAKRKAWAENPNRFVRDVFRVTPEPWQDEVLAAFNTSPRIAINGSKNTGKSTVESWLIWFFLVTRYEPKVAATSVSEDNLRDCLWSELAKWQKQSKLLESEYQWTAERVFLKARPETWWCSARTWAKSADKAEQAKTLAGLHANSVFFVLDESGGIPDAVMSAAEGALAGGEHGECHILQGGNPTDNAGPLFKACTVDRKHWNVFTVTGDPDDPKRSARVSISWARELIEMYGVDHDWVRVNVFAKFPKQGSDVWFSLDSIEAAASRRLDRTAFDFEAKVLGVDVSRGGANESVIQPRQGLVAFKPETERGQPDTMLLADHVAVVASAWRDVAAIFVDADGVGQGVADRLKQLGFPAFAIHSGVESHRTDVRFYNLRAQMWWDMSQWMKRGSIPNDATLRSQFHGEKCPKYSFDNRGRYKLETKDEMKRRGVDSPDRADALAYTFAMPVQPKPSAIAPLVDRNLSAGRVTTEFNPFVSGHPDAPRSGVPSPAYGQVESSSGRCVTEFDPFAGENRPSEPHRSSHT